jgi:hypothetical protein
MTIIIVKYYLRNHIKMDGMGGARGTLGGRYCISDFGREKTTYQTYAWIEENY